MCIDFKGWFTFFEKRRGGLLMDFISYKDFDYYDYLNKI